MNLLRQQELLAKKLSPPAMAGAVQEPILVVHVCHVTWVVHFCTSTTLLAKLPRHFRRESSRLPMNLRVNCVRDLWLPTAPSQVQLSDRLDSQPTVRRQVQRSLTVHFRQLVCFLVVVRRHLSGAHGPPHHRRLRCACRFRGAVS